MLFSNVTGDSAVGYLSDGLASEIATSLARVPRLEVRSPGAVRSAQRGAGVDPAAIGRRLNVRHVVEGDYQRGGDRIRIAVRLVTVPDGTQRWAQSFTRPASDLLAVQEEIASAVATAIAGQLLPQERTVLAERATRNAEAHDRLLRGNSALARRTPAGVSQALAEYSAAARLDSGFAVAHARIALCYALYLVWGWDYPGVPPDSQLALGFVSAERALALDSLLADGWMARGYMLAHRNPRTLDGVLAAVGRATVLAPANPEAWHQYGTWLAFSGRSEEAITAIRRALALEPGRAVSWSVLGAFIYQPLRRIPEALAALDSSIATDPDFFSSYAYRSLLRLGAGDSAGARRDAQTARRLSSGAEDYYGLVPMAAVAASAGDTVQARRLIDQAAARFEQRAPGNLPGQLVAMGYMAVGASDRALDILERIRPRGALLDLDLQVAAFDPLRSDPRFQRIVQTSQP